MKKEIKAETSQVASLDWAGEGSEVRCKSVKSSTFED
jgi:hypothetical protein